ncbi:MAG: hypothetical protein WBG86_04780, partial [Polyangiales bacterium]
MSERAEPCLPERIAHLEALLSQACDADPVHEDAAETAQALVWCHIDAGAIGTAFELLWSESSPIDSETRHSLRAELQAYCGNEGAALDLLRSVP